MADNRSVLSRVAQGAISIGSGVPSAQIDTIRANRDMAQQGVELNQQSIDANTAEGERQARIGELKARAAQGDANALNELIAADPKVGQQLLEAAGIRDQNQREEAAVFADQLLSTEDPAQREGLIRKRVVDLTNAGRDPQHTATLLGQSPEDQNFAAQGMRAAALSAKDRASGGGAGKLGAGVVVQKDDGTFAFSNPVLGNKGFTTESSPIDGTPVSRIGETAANRQARDLATAGGSEAARQEAATAATPEKVKVEGIAKRRQDNISQAIVAADALPTLSRAIELLDSVETGGFDAAALKAKQLFGLESANEAELSNSMGKAVLSQLRDTFGAAFTAQEGQSLKEIEANFGKSTAGNKRLLQRARRLTERAVDRGIKSAIDNEDFEAAAQIKAARDFKLSEPEANEVDSLLEHMTPEERKLFEK